MRWEFIEVTHALKQTPGGVCWLPACCLLACCLLPACLPACLLSACMPACCMLGSSRCSAPTFFSDNLGPCSSPRVATLWAYVGAAVHRAVLTYVLTYLLCGHMWGQLCASSCTYLRTYFYLLCGHMWGQLCIELLWSHPIKELDGAHANELQPRQPSPSR